MFSHQSFSKWSYFPPVWFAEADESHLLPEERNYYGSGQASRTEVKREADDDLIALVIDKWETIERAQEESRARELLPNISDLEADEAFPDPAVYSQVNSAVSIPLDLDPSSPESERLAREAIAKASAQQRKDEEALIMILAQL